jgi:hypothetical protein
LDFQHLRWQILTQTHFHQENKEDAARFYGITNLKTSCVLFVLSVEKEALIRQLHAEGKAIAAIARLVGLSRKSVYKALESRDVA